MFVRVNVRLRGAPPDTFVHVPLSDVNTFLAVRVVILHVGIACLHPCLNKCLIERVVRCARLDVHRARVATIVIAALVERFSLAEVR
ncbi:hypothetical protein D3C84_1207370 [compost metagenome]